MKDLPPENVIEKALEAYATAIAKDGTAAGATAEAQRLSQLLLQPVARELKNKRRLLIVAPWGLHTVPFGALPDPNSGDHKPLIEKHEVQYLPSVSAVLALARSRQRQRPPRREIAVLADPKLGRLERIPQSVQRVTRSAGWKTQDLPRLLNARWEAQDIQQWFKEPKLLLREEANRDWVLGGGLSEYRIIRFATHAFSNPLDTDLSRLVLSMVGPDGKPREGLLSFSDIWNLKVNADLVILNACETAVESKRNTSAPLSLAAAFLKAGAGAVIASLWRVEDRPAAELMRAFYAEHIGNKQPAGEALRRAQLKLAGSDRWKAPKHWAGFHLIGYVR